ncbi:MAG TPA: hypothetical protein DHV28_13550 [Ignavibacteriales bacterium]|nr:hypothetical protein [Ignavibacteriales bacterium]
MNILTPHQESALQTAGHLALTANAGSGKTFVLARKYLDALIKDNLEISTVAAITFTEKAASELYQKISVLIEERIKDPNNIQDKKKLEKIRRQLVSANISTIHSFCISILREYPVEAELDARFIPIDENLSEELIELSVEEMIRTSFENELINEELKYLIRIFSSKSKLQKQLINLIKNRKNVFTIRQKIYSLSEQNIADLFYEEFSKNFFRIWNKLKNQFIENLNIINSLVLEEDSKNQNAIEIKGKAKLLYTESNLKNVVNLLNDIRNLAFTDKYLIRTRGYLKNAQADSIPAELSNVQVLMKTLHTFQIPDNHKEIELELARLGKTLLTFFEFALNNYADKKRNEGYIDYEDVLLHTKLLLENSDVKKALTAKYNFIMVDEFQDTNEIQYQIFLPILDYLKGGKLFIVGDEKQSIYKFRDAEIEIFNQTRNDIKNSVGDKNLLVLPDSFRMTPAICAFCNHIFKNLFNEPDETLGEVPATDLVCARVDDKKGHVEFLISREDEDNSTNSESELVAKKILSIITNNQYNLRDISVLVRKRKYFADLEKVFTKYQIPFSIVGGTGFYQKQIISDIFNYLSFLADENNSTALAGLLRSPFFNVSDSRLFEISLNKGRSFWKKLTFLKDEKDLSEIYNLLTENISISSSISLPDLIYKIVTDRNFLSILSTRNDSYQEIANLNKVINIARNFNAVGFRNLYDFLTFMKDSIAGLTDEAQAAITSNADAVQMMTIHQAKGLEFPVVFLYKTDESGISASIKSGEVKIDKKFGLLTKVPINQNYLEDYLSAPVNSIYNYFEENKNNAELKRLLYVALTRAKDELYITTAIKTKSDFKKDSFIDLLAKGLKNNFLSDEIAFTENLEMLSIIEKKYINKTEQINLNIPLTSGIDEKFKEIESSIRPYNNVVINPASLHSHEKGEIISASKVSIYSQCPLKYLLTYEYGFGKFNSDYLNFKLSGKQSGYRFFSDNSEEEKSELTDERFETFENQDIDYDASLYGRLFHKAMEKSINTDDLDNFIVSEIGSGNNNQNLNPKLHLRLKTDIEAFKKSKIYSDISNAANYKNEFEIYVADEDYFLHGIIDKIIFDGDKILIYDYKTDDIEKKEIIKHANYYLMQLKFYLYIASKLFIRFNNFEGNLIFVKHPDDIVNLRFDRNQMKKLEEEIKSIINAIRMRNHEKNPEHCRVCPFSGLTNKCIIN